MQIQCPSCSQMLEVTDAQAGQVVACPGCKGQMQVPAAAAPVAMEMLSAVPGTMGTGSEPTKKCPFCGETVLKVARKCKHCKEDLPEGCDGETVRLRLAEKEKKLAGKLASGQLSAFAWPKFRKLTLILAGSAAFALLVTILSFSAKGDDFMFLGVMGVISLIILGISILVAFVNDMQLLACSSRKTPEKALKAFLYAIRMGRYDCAYACLLDGDKDGVERLRRKIPSVSVGEARVSFAELAGFKEYWRELTHPTGAQMRRAVLSGFQVSRTQGDFAVVTASMKIESYPWALLIALPLALLPVAIVISVITKRETVDVTKLLRKADGQWWVVNGELESPEDRAIDVVAKAAAGPQL